MSEALKYASSDGRGISPEGAWFGRNSRASLGKLTKRTRWKAEAADL